jgi:hypothetical protein
MPWVGGRYTIVRGIKIPRVGGQDTMDRGRNTIGRVGENTMGRRVKIPRVGGQNVMGRGSIYHR